MSNDEDLGSGKLLRDIEEISQALYLHKGPSKALVPTSRFGSESKAVLQEVFPKNKNTSIWRWNPLKTLMHIRGHHRFNCLFFLHVHSVEGLASNFNDLTLCVNCKRKDEVFRTHPVRVSQGIAEFEETLMHHCSVSVSRNGPQHSLKYDPKLFLLQASVIGAPTLDIGKHWVDFARLLPLTFEELEEEKRMTGKWTTGFKLKGKAKGATLNVSFGFSILGDNPFDPSHFMKVSDIIGVNGHTAMHSPAGISEISSIGSALKRLGSVSRKSARKFHHFSSQSLDMECFHEVSSNPNSELAQSMSFLCQKLDEGKISNLNFPDGLHEDLVPPSTMSASLTEIVCGDPGNELEDIDFIVIEKGIELPVNDELNHDHDDSQNDHKFVIHIVDAAEIFPEDLENCSESGEPNSKHTIDFDNLIGNARNSKYEDDNERVKEPTEDELQTFSCNFLASESAELNSSLSTTKFIEQENNMESKPSHRIGKMVRSLSVDDVTEFVADGFLHMFGTEHNSGDMNSDCEPESPREHLLRKFEEECCVFGDSVLNLDSVAEQMEPRGVARTGSGRACVDDFDLSLAIQEAEREYNRVTQSLRSRRNAKMLENLETETLMEKWGLDEKLFQNSPQTICDGFGSPIYVPSEEPSVLPPVGEGLGPLLRNNGGGLLRSMSSSLFRRARNGAKLIMQVSNQVVLPQMMGSDVMDILQCWASGGAENVIVEANEVMPLQCITENVLNRLDEWGSPVVQNAQSLGSGSILENLHSECVSIDDLVPLALANIEVLSIEALRIQSGLSYEEALSSIRPPFIGNYISKGERAELDEVAGPGVTASRLLDLKNKNNFNDLMRLSISLDEWIRLDALDVDFEGELDGYMLNILEAHHAKLFNLDSEQLTASGSECGLFDNNFTLAFRLQLRDPLRDYDMVGEPMLVLVRVEKVPILPPQEMVNISAETNIGKQQSDFTEATSFPENARKINSRVIPLFKISEVHVAGLNVVPNDRQVVITEKYKQSGARWLLSSGMKTVGKRPFSKSNAIIKPSSELLRKADRDILWSISSHAQHATKWKELAELSFIVRNPDIILPSGPVRSLKA